MVGTTRVRPAAATEPRVRRRRTRGLLLGVLVLLAIPVLAVALLWPLTPSVADAEQRVAAHLAQHGATDPHALARPNRVGLSIVATEDSRFYAHHGLDALGVARAVMAALGGSTRDMGGATLDQQLVKNLYTGNGLLAKAEQIELSFKLEARYSKSQILEMYLSDVYFGHGYYGLPAAARGYFGVAPADLTWAQASLLGGLVQAPSAYDPYTHLELAKRRQRHVLDRLVATHHLTTEQAAVAFAAPLNLR